MVLDYEEKPTVPSAPTLLKLAANAIIANSELLLPNNQVEIRQNEVEVILNQTRNHKFLPDQGFFEHFIDGTNYPTSILPVCSIFISDETFAKTLIGQSKNLREVDLTGNKSLGSTLLLDYLLKFKDSLPQLTTLFTSSQWMLSMYKDCANEDESNLSIELPQRTRSQAYSSALNEVVHFTQFFPEIQHFRHTLIDDYCSVYEKRVEFMTRVLFPLHSLQILELYKWSKLSTMEFLTPLSSTLTTLRLYDCPDVKAGMLNIMKLKNLEYLDISQSLIGNGIFSKPASTLYDLVSALPKLKKLDIANTNLCLPYEEDEDRPEQRLTHVQTDVHGLAALHKNLEFLSVFHCDHISPSTKLPAYCICSELTEEHLLVGLRVYMDRPEILQSILNEVFQIYRLYNDEANDEHVNGLYLILEALATHRYNRTLQISGTAALFYAIRSTIMDAVVKRRVVEVMLNALENFNDEAVIVRNASLSFCQLNIPNDVAFCYTQMVSLLVNVLNSHAGDSTTPRVVIYLLNSMACQTGHDAKVEVGMRGAIQAIMTHISRKLERQVCDETVEVAWSFLWNITDETPLNCSMFLKKDGITLFWRCYKEWSVRKDLVRNMLGLIGNIAEVEHLRNYLMDDNLIKIFLDLLDVLQTNGDGIETSYNSAGVLAQLLSDGNWDCVTVSKEFITNRIIATTSKWAIDSKRFINYRSFGPILRLLPLYDSPGSQVWALFAIANLTTTDKQKYCEFVVKEGGIPLLNQIQTDARSNKLMLYFSKIVLDNVSSQNSVPSNSEVIVQ